MTEHSERRSSGLPVSMKAMAEHSERQIHSFSDPVSEGPVSDLSVLEQTVSKTETRSVAYKCNVRQEQLYLLGRGRSSSLPHMCADVAFVGDRGKLLYVLQQLCELHMALRTRRFSALSKGLVQEIWIGVDDMIIEPLLWVPHMHHGLVADLELGKNLWVVSAGRQSFKLLVHPILGDEWSCFVLKKDYQLLLADCATGVLLRDSECFEVALWEEQCLAKNADLKRWWKQELANTEAPTLLGSACLCEERKLSVEFPQGVVWRVLRVAHKARASILAVWLAVFAVFLWKSSDNDCTSVLVPSMVARRSSKFLWTVGVLENIILFKFLKTACTASFVELAKYSIGVLEASLSRCNFPLLKVIEKRLVRNAHNLGALSFNWSKPHVDVVPRPGELFSVFCNASNAVCFARLSHAPKLFGNFLSVEQELSLPLHFELAGVHSCAKKRILVVIGGTQGDIRPFVAIGKEIARRELALVGFATQREFFEMVQRHVPDASLFPLHRSGNDLLKGDRFKVFLRESATSVERETFARDHLVPMNEENCGDVVMALRLFRPDLVVSNFVVQPAAEFACRLLTLPLCVGLSFPYWDQNLLPEHNRATVDLFRMLSNVASENIPIHRVALYPEMIVPMSSAGLDIVQGGFCILEEENSFVPPTHLREFLDSGDKPVYLGFGSMPVDVDVIAQNFARACASCKLRGLVASGWSQSNSPFSSNDRHMMFIKEAPHDWLFPKCLAVIHHGGAGTTMTALLSGVPSIIYPVWADQAFWASRCASLGVGPSEFLPAERIDFASLTANLKFLTAEVISRATMLGRRLRMEDGLNLTVLQVGSVLFGKRKSVRASLVRSNYDKDNQEEEWGAGPCGVWCDVFQHRIAAQVSTYNTAVVDLSRYSTSATLAFHLIRGQDLAMLAVSVALHGAAFLAIDAAYNAEVVAFRLADSNAWVCFRDVPLLNGSGRTSQCWARALSLSKPRKTAFRASGEQTAYITYTSGSTGQPKGVEILQRNVPYQLEFLRCLSLQICLEDVFLWHSSVSFDQFIVDVFAWFFSCKALILSSSLAEAESLEGVSVCFFVPSQLQVITDFKHVQVTTMRLVFCAGETLSLGLAARVHTMFSSSAVFNLYGPTECTVSVCATRLDRTAVKEMPPVGRPILASEILLDGQRCVSVKGRSVGGGYKNLRQKTTESFWYSHAENDGKSKLYRTGDLGWFFENGMLGVRGRMDDQVKISGQRVEIGAVESAVLSCFGVKACSVVAVESRSGGTSLVAFVVLFPQSWTREGLALASALRDEIGRRVARHEVPQRVIVVEKIPLTAAGKVDRVQLKVMIPSAVSCVGDDVLEERSGKGEEPESLPMRVAEAMREVLGCSLDDILGGRTFWELGGTSVLAVRLDGLLQARVGASVGTAKMMRDGSLDGLVRMCKMGSGESMQPFFPMRMQVDESKFATKRNTLAHVSSFHVVSESQEEIYLREILYGPWGMTFSIGLDFLGNHEVEYLRAALKCFCEAHSALRTRKVIEVPGGLVVQEVCGTAYQCQSHFLSADDSEEVRLVKAKWQAKLLKLNAKGLAAVLFVATDTRCMALFRLHQIICDVTSIGIVSEDFTSLMRAERNQLGKGLQCWEYAELSRETQILTKDETKKWWCRHLRGCGVVVVDGMTGSAEGKTPTLSTWTFSQHIREIIQQLSRKAHSSRFVVLQMFVAFFAWRFADDDVVLLPGLCSVRHHLEIARTLGYLNNTVVFKYDMIQLTGVDTIEAVRRSTSVVSETLEKGAVYSLSRLRREVSLRNGHVLPSLLVKYVESGNYSTLGDLTELSIAVSDDGLFVETSLPGDLFESLCRVVAAGTCSRHMFIRDGCNKSNLQVDEWTGSVHATTQHLTLQRIVRSCRALDCCSALVIDTVRSFGRSDGLVGFHMRRCKELICLTYTVASVGFAFLPIDAQYSNLVVCWRLAASGSACCFVDIDKVNVCPVGVVHAAGTRSDRNMARSSPVVVCGASKAYVCFTSGSTGKPKAVSILQRNVSNLCLWLDKGLFQMEQHDVFLWQASISFDHFVSHLLWPLARNGSCCIVRDGDEVNMQKVAHILSSSRTSVLFFVPTHLQMLCSVFQEHCYAAQLRLVMTAGEMLSWKLLCVFKSTCDNRALIWNVYGPTETTVDVAAFSTSVERGEVVHAGSVPIGRPFPNTSNVCIGKVVLSCVSGELMLRGKSVGSGYLNQKSLTREKFVYDVMENNGVARMYHSGDCARIVGTGDVVYQGRKDDQLKVSGQRVEPGAVESAVLSCAEVKQCAVLLASCWEDTTALVAFVVMAEGSARTAVSIREEMTSRVARHEVPHKIVVIDRIPLAVSGKADRAALRKLLSEGAKVLQSEVNETEKESHVRRLLRALLNDGLEDGKTFWEAGGSSMMAIAFQREMWRAGFGIGFREMFLDGSFDGLVRSALPLVNETRHKIEPGTAKDPVSVPCLEAIFERSLQYSRRVFQQAWIGRPPPSTSAMFLPFCPEVTCHFITAGSFT